MFSTLSHLLHVDGDVEVVQDVVHGPGGPNQTLQDPFNNASKLDSLI